MSPLAKNGRRPGWVRIAAAFVIGVVVLSLGKWQWSNLPGGVELARNAEGNQSLIVKREGVRIPVVGPDVQWARGHGVYVYGYKKGYPAADGTMSPEGYFVFDTSRRQAQEGLSLADAERVLGISVHD